MKITHPIVAALLFGTVLASAQHPSMPQGMSHEEHLRQLERDAALKRRGLVAMGFDQGKAAHHFLLRASGGSIVVTANDPADSESTKQIQSHLREIAGAFANGAFDKPVETHAELPPGAALMAVNRRLISYTYRERADGGEVEIASNDVATVHAIHEFLRYQIVEHKTGDPLSPPPAEAARPPASLDR